MADEDQEQLSQGSKVVENVFKRISRQGQIGIHNTRFDSVEHPSPIGVVIPPKPGDTQPSGLQAASKRIEESQKAVPKGEKKQ
jgi:hypothetical protein